jgi:Mg2+/citrate symporter
MPPCEYATRERERVEEKGYKRDKRLWDEDKEERRKRVRRRKGKKKNMEKRNELFFMNYVFKIILIKILLDNWI